MKLKYKLKVKLKCLDIFVGSLIFIAIMLMAPISMVFSWGLVLYTIIRLKKGKRIKTY